MKSKALFGIITVILVGIIVILIAKPKPSIITSTHIEEKSQVSTCTPSSPPSISILAPNGGEVYHVGDTIVLTWESCNVPAGTPITGELNDVIHQGGPDDNSRSLFCEGSDTPGYSSSPQCQNTGTRTITLNQFIVPGSYTIRISNGLQYPSNLHDSSDAAFTIN